MTAPAPGHPQRPDELTTRVRALDAERARPTVRGDTRPHPAGSVEVLLGELVAALAGLCSTPSDEHGAG